jgi:hypothetical protein
VSGRHVAALRYLAAMPRFAAIAPVFAVRDLDAALVHYGRLGFAAEPHASGGYGVARRGNVVLHLVATPDLDPLTSTSRAYLYVDDADALHAEWSGTAHGGSFTEPADTTYGFREGAHIDTDGNLLRYGSPLT